MIVFHIEHERPHDNELHRDVGIIMGIEMSLSIIVDEGVLDILRYA
jgi:hypothetical protein